MHESTQKPLNLLKLAKARRAYRVSYDASDLKRVVAEGVTIETPVDVSLTASRMDASFGGGMQVSGHMRGGLELTCQRCTHPVSVGLDRPFRWWFGRKFNHVETTEESPILQSVDAQWEYAKADFERFDALTWIEDDMLLSLNELSWHASAQVCEELAPDEMQWRAQQVRSPNTQTPFADLNQRLAIKAKR